MYVHIGADFVLHKNDILGIFDLDSLYLSQSMKTHLKKLEDDNRLINISNALPKSVVFAFFGGEEVAYMSPLSSKTIQNRKNIYSKG